MDSIISGVNELPEYTAVIRTLGKAGTKYQQLLDNLKNQTHKPSKIIAYLAEGYDLPSETIGIEQIVYVPKGMVAQRALPYSEVDTDWMLMLDDDIGIEPDGVERLFNAIRINNADVIAIDGFPHHIIPWKTKFAMMFILSSIPRFFGNDLGYTVNCIGSDIYNNNPHRDVTVSTTNSGNAFLCRKKDFLKIHFEHDLWLDESPYAIPEDKVMFYKMHLNGLKILTHYKSGFTHLDAGTSMTDERLAKTAYSLARNRYIFYHLYVWPNLSLWKKTVAVILRTYQTLAESIYHAVERIRGYRLSKYREQGLQDAKLFLKSYKHNG